MSAAVSAPPEVTIRGAFMEDLLTVAAHSIPSNHVSHRWNGAARSLTIVGELLFSLLDGTTRAPIVMPTPQENFRACLLAIAGLAENATPEELATCNRAFRDALLTLASSGEDNLACVAEISIGRVVDKAADGTPYQGPAWGLRLTQADEVGLSNLLWTAEGCPIPDAVRAALPAVTQSQWDATIRLMTLICTALESPAANAR